jgi:hypothetical protein
MLVPLAVAAILFLCSLLSYAAAMQLIVKMAVTFLRSGQKELGFWSGTATMGKVALIMAAAHLIQITLWSAAIVLCGQIPGFETAFYFSAQNYTTLGYGDIHLSEQWRLLGPLEAINGVLFFGLSTSVMFAGLSQLIANRLRTEAGYHDEALWNPAPLAIADNA